MGFSMTMYQYPKKEGKHYTINDVLAIEKYYNFAHSDWAQKNYKNSIAYMNSNRISQENQLTAEDAEMFSKDALFEISASETEYHIANLCFDTCSDGAFLFDFIREQVSKENDGCIELSKEHYLRVLEYCWDTYSSQFSSQYYIERAFTYVQNNDGEENFDIVSKKINGIEVLDDDMHMRRIETDFDEPTIALPQNGYIDFVKVNICKMFIDATKHILKDDKFFEKNILVICGGW